VSFEEFFMAAISYPALTNCQAPGVSPDHRSINVAGWLKRTLQLWRSRIKERHSFDFVDDRELRDLGLSKWDVEREIAKPFWRG
jgi:uncharacterized protein YjiS (DUF1127 family)